jgi:dTDP-4-dehydrorhamnose 3,5-epimerase-like enzyme
MPETYPIHDLYIKRIQPVDDSGGIRWLALRDTDHILHRFGLAEVIRARGSSKLRMREVADEVWTLCEGRVEFHWHDLREKSPTYDHRHSLICDHPTVMLVPFGVAFGFRVLKEPATLLRLATHDEGVHEGHEQIPWEDEA